MHASSPLRLRPVLGAAERRGGAGGLTGTADTSPSRAQLASIVMRVRTIASYQSCSSPRPRAGTTVAAAPLNHGLASVEPAPPARSAFDRSGSVAGHDVDAPLSRRMKH